MSLVLAINYLICLNIYINVNTNASLVLIIYFAKTWKIKNEWEVTISNDKIQLFLRSPDKGIDYIWNNTCLLAMISNMVLLHDTILFLIITCTIDGETNYYGNYKLSRLGHNRFAIKPYFFGTNSFLFP